MIMKVVFMMVMMMMILKMMGKEIMVATTKLKMIHIVSHWWWLRCQSCHDNAVMTIAVTMTTFDLWSLPPATPVGGETFSRRWTIVPREQILGPCWFTCYTFLSIHVQNTLHKYFLQQLSNFANCDYLETLPRNRMILNSETIMSYKYPPKPEDNYLRSHCQCQCQCFTIRFSQGRWTYE